MDLNEKIKQILAAKNMSPSSFADEIGIQRSSMSHILAGRNKPSLDIVQKIVKRFPELGTNWILDDEDLPAILPEHAASDKPLENDSESADKYEGRVASRSALNARKHSNEKGAQPMQHVPNQNATKRIDKILIFYTDGTFEEARTT